MAKSKIYFKHIVSAPKKYRIGSLTTGLPLGRILSAEKPEQAKSEPRAFRRRTVSDFVALYSSFPHAVNTKEALYVLIK